MFEPTNCVKKNVAPPRLIKVLKNWILDAFTEADVKLRQGIRYVFDVDYFMLVELERELM